MSWEVLVELLLEHDYYAPGMPPVTARAEDSAAFGRDGLLLRQSGARIYVLAEDDASELPVSVTLDLEAQNRDVIAVTAGADWATVPRVRLDAEHDTAVLEPDSASDVRQLPGRLRLAQVMIDVDPSTRRTVSVRFPAMSSHWAYHVIGPAADDVVIEDAEGEVIFDAMGTVSLPDGTPARVIRSRAALPARARPGQRFSLSRPGPFGPRTLIPVLPAPHPLFAEVPGPDGGSAIIQSDIYVSIF